MFCGFLRFVILCVSSLRVSVIFLRGRILWSFFVMMGIFVMFL